MSLRKTHVALGLGLAARQKGIAVGFTTAAALVHELMEARDETPVFLLSLKAGGVGLTLTSRLSLAARRMANDQDG